MTKSKSKPLGFALRGIELLNINIMHPQRPLATEEAFTFNINLEHRVRPDDKLIFVICTVEVSEEASMMVVGGIKASCIYEVNEISGFIDSKTNQVNLPEEFIIALNSITLSTTRGIMFANFRGTFLDKAHLPIIDPSAFKANT